MDKGKGNEHKMRLGQREIFDALLGPDDDFLEGEHAEEFLLAFGIDPTTLVSEFKEHLEERARQHQSEKGSVPSSISGALRGIRESIKSSNPTNVDPASHIDLFLAGGLGGGRSIGSAARSFRREGDDELCEEDEKLLDELEGELGQDDETK